MTDVDTPEGMATAKEWMGRLFEATQPVFQWGVPRADTVYHIDKVRRIFVRSCGNGDAPTEQVLEAMGFTLSNN